MDESGGVSDGLASALSETGRTSDRRRNRQCEFPLAQPDGSIVIANRRSGEQRRRRPMGQFLLFRNIDDERLLPVLAGCTVLEYAEGEVLLAPGQPNHDIYVVLSGALHVRIGSDHSAPPLAIESGECVGEMSIIDGKPVSALVSASSASRVLAIPASVFWSRLITLPDIARNLLSILSERMRQDNEVIVQNVKSKLQYEHLEKELQTARVIQSSMVPRGRLHFPGHDDFDVYTLMDPAREIGGDCFDAFLVSGDKLFFAIGDVSGKGVPAALFMVRTLTLLRTEATRNQAPHEVLMRVNQQLCQNNDHGMFVTVLCAMLDLAEGEMTYCSGGHDAPLIGSTSSTFRFAEPAPGPMLGVDADVGYESRSVSLNPGDLVLCYTDGVTEAMNLSNEMFGVERMRMTLEQMDNTDVVSAVSKLHHEIKSFAHDAPQSDDIAMLAVQYRGARAAKKLGSAP